MYHWIDSVLGIRVFGGTAGPDDIRSTKIRIWSLILRLTANGQPVDFQVLTQEAGINDIGVADLLITIGELLRDGDLRQINNAFLPRGALIRNPQGQIRGIPATALDRNRAQSLATLIQSQDAVTWIALSLAITTEAVLLAAFVQHDATHAGRHVLAVSGSAFALIFRALVGRSNVDMSNYYGLASYDYPDTFHFPASIRTRIRARNLMLRVLEGLVAGWVLGFVYLENIFGIRPFL